MTLLAQGNAFTKWQTLGGALGPQSPVSDNFFTHPLDQEDSRPASQQLLLQGKNRIKTLRRNFHTDKQVSWESKLYEPNALTLAQALSWLYDCGQIITLPYRGKKGRRLN